MEIKHEKPEIYKKLHDRFGVNWDDGIIIADAPHIYCKYDISPEKIVHEMVHIKQQTKMGKELWWQLYLSQDTFRLEQEVEAYRSEYSFLKRHVKDRELLHKLLLQISKHLSSEQYGDILTEIDARKLIRN